MKQCCGRNLMSGQEKGQKSTDFIIGEDNFKDLEIRAGDPKTGFYYFYDNSRRGLIKRFVLGVSKIGIKTCCCVTFIEKDGKYSPHVEFATRDADGKLTLNHKTLGVQKAQVRARVDLSEYHENFWELIDYIYSIAHVDIPRSGWMAISTEDRALLDQIIPNREFIEKVISTFSTKQAQDLLVQAKKGDINNLFAAIKQAKNKKALNELEKLVQNGSSEQQLKTWIKENDWVFGVEYIRGLDLHRIGIHADADFLVESLDGFVDLIELKKASVNPLFKYDSSHNSYYPSVELSKVIGQTIQYLKIMEDMRLHLKSEDGLNVLKPRAKVVIGRSSEMNEQERNALRLLNDTLHNIEVITYDDIIYRARRIVKHYENDDRIIFGNV